MGRRKKTRAEIQSIEHAAQFYRDAIAISGDVDEAERILDEVIRPPCERMMLNFGIRWNDKLEAFLNAVLLSFSRFDGVRFLDFFIRNARHNFDIPTEPLNTETENLYHGTELTPFLRTWESHPERHAISKVDRQKKKQKKRPGATTK